MGVAGAAWATVIGQFLSLFVAMIFHYTVNKEIDKNLKYIKPDLGLIKGIYRPFYCNYAIITFCYDGWNECYTRNSKS